MLIPQHLRWLSGLKMAFISKLLYTFQKLDMFLCKIFDFTTTWCSESFKFQIGSCEHESKTAVGLQDGTDTLAIDNTGRESEAKERRLREVFQFCYV